MVCQQSVFGDQVTGVTIVTGVFSLLQEKMECSETPNLEKHLEGWLEEVTNLFPHRKVKALVLDITGKSVCVTRFVRPLPLPPIGEDEENTTQELIARFVSMIPHVTESTISSRFFDIWLNADVS